MVIICHRAFALKRFTENRDLGLILKYQ